MKPVVMITGASAGIGEAIARQTASQGARVALLARRAQQLDILQSEITAQGGEALSIPTDVSDSESLRDAFHEVKDIWGRLDILFNNAAVLQPVSLVHELPDDKLKDLLMINIFGAFAATREALVLMREQARGGTIVNISSGASYKPYRGWSAYGSSKAALDMLTRISALENADRHVRIFAIAPGVVNTDMQTAIRNEPVEKFPEVARFIDLYQRNRLVDPADVAVLLTSLVFSDWTDLTGKVINIHDPEFQRDCRAHRVEIPAGIEVI